MTSFDKWASDLADSIKNTKDIEDGEICQELMEYNDGKEPYECYVYPCRGCGENTIVEDPEDFNPDMSYCGGSPRCCP